MSAVIKKSVLGRRSLMASTTALTVVAAMGLPLQMPLAQAADASAADIASFHAVSEFITGQKLSTVLAKRYSDAMTAQDAAFPQKLSALAESIKPFQLQGIDALLAAVDKSNAVYDTIHAMTSAWYLGVVGTGGAAKLIAFHDALMFRPTHDYVFVPSYGGGPNSWVSETHILSAPTKA